VFGDGGVNNEFCDFPRTIGPSKSLPPPREILWLLLGNTHLETRLPLYLTGWEGGGVTQVQLSIEVCGHF
jgi:hypothetical protein